MRPFSFDYRDSYRIQSTDRTHHAPVPDFIEDVHERVAASRRPGRASLARRPAGAKGDKHDLEIAAADLL
jgi:hypothetical protein